MERVSDNDPRLDQLQGWLTMGWEIEEPVLRRNAYYTAAGRVCAFEIVVQCRGERRVVALRDDPAVQTFLTQHRLAVLDLS